MILDFRAVTRPDLPPGATVVVGAGAAGLALALALADRGETVVVVESGGEPGGEPPHGQGLNDGSGSGLPYRGLTQGRSRELGGSTSLWHGQCMRLHEIDLRRRAWVAHSGWPLEPADLDPHYDAAERWLEVSGRGYDEQRWAEHPRLRPPDWDPRLLRHDFTEYAPDPHLGRRFRPQLQQHATLHVLTNATASRVLTGQGSVSGVEVLGLDGRRETLPAERVVLAGGAIENARLLLLSDPEGTGLGDGRRHTGRYLQDHAVLRTAEVLAADRRFLQDRYVALHRGGRQLFPKVRLAPEAQEQHGLLDAAAVFLHEHDQTALDAAHRLARAARARQRPERLAADARVALGAVGPLARAGYRRYVRGVGAVSRPTHVWLDLWLEQAPDPDRRVCLGQQPDILGLPQAHVVWNCHDEELETSRRMTEWIGAELERCGIGTLRHLPPMDDDDAWRATVVDAYHPAGTTRMSTGPEDGVVDTNLEVHGVSGLFVVGSSVFPTSGYANPTLTIVALALRLALHLVGAKADRTR